MEANTLYNMVMLTPHRMELNTQYPPLPIWPPVKPDPPRPNPPHRANIMRVNLWPREGLYLACVFILKQLLEQQPAIQENFRLSKQAAHHYKMSYFVNEVNFLIFPILNPHTPQSSAIPVYQASSTTTETPLGALILALWASWVTSIWKVCQPPSESFQPPTATIVTLFSWQRPT